jgi:hypothetical protein
MVFVNNDFLVEYDESDRYFARKRQNEWAPPGSRAVMPRSFSRLVPGG